MNNSEKTNARTAQREYHRKWRAEHREQVHAAQMRYWAKKARESRSGGSNEAIEPDQKEGG